MSEYLGSDQDEPVAAQQEMRQMFGMMRLAPLALLGLGCVVLGVLLYKAWGDTDKAGERERLAKEETEAARRDAVGQAQAAQAKLTNEASEKDNVVIALEHERATREKAERERETALGQVKAANAARLSAIKERDDATGKEGELRTQAQLAEGLSKKAEERRQLAVRENARLMTAAGIHAQDQGDLPQALLWFAEVLRFAQHERLPEDAHRLRLAVALSQHPKLAQNWFLEKPASLTRISPDGKLAAAADADGTIHIWEIATGKPTGDLVADVPVTALLFSTDSKRVYRATQSAMGVGVVSAIDVATRKLTFQLPEFEDHPVTLMQLSPDGRRLVTVSQRPGTPSATVQVWDTEKGTTIGKPFEQTGAPVALKFNADGQELFLLGSDRTLRRWNAASGEPSGIHLGGGTLALADFSADGSRLATLDEDRTLRIWRVPSGEAATPPVKQSSPVQHLEFSPDGKRFLIVSGERVRVCDAATAAVGNTLRHPQTVSQTSFGPDGRHILTVCSDGRVRLWDVTSGEERVSIWPATAPHEVALGVGGAMLFVNEGTQLSLWDLSASEPLSGAIAEKERAWFSADGKTGLRVTPQGPQLFTVADGKSVGAPLKLSKTLASASFSADGKRLLTVANQVNGDEGDGEVAVWDAMNGTAVGKVYEHIRPVIDAAFSPDGNRLATVCRDRKVRVWDVATSAVVGKEMDNQQHFARVMWHPSGKRLITVEARNQTPLVHFWNLETEQKTGHPLQHDTRFTQVVLSGDGKYLATASADGMARVWDGASGEELGEKMKHPESVTFVAFNSDNKKVLTVCADRSVRVWDSATGKPLTPPLAHPAPVALAAFSPNGRWLATASGNQVRLWDMETGEPIGPSLRHGADERQPITYLSFNSEGNLTTGAGLAADPRGRQTWNFASNRPVTDLLDMVTAITGHHFEEAKNTTPLKVDEAKKVLEVLRTRYTPDFSPSPERVLAWSNNGFKQCEAEENWPGAVYHLDRLISLNPDAIDLYLHRAKLNSRMKQTEHALADYGKALERKPDRADLWSARAGLYVELRQWDKAVADYQKAITVQPNDADALANLGRVLAELGRWDEAASTLSRAILQGREEAAVWRDHGLVRLAKPDLEGYRTICRKMEKQFGRQSGSVFPWLCTLAPDAVTDFKAALRSAETTSTDPATVRNASLTVGALLFRSGQAQPALERLEKLQADRKADELPYDWYFLALVQQKLGHAGEAKKWFEKAVPAQEAATGKGTLTWQQRVELASLRKEAEAVLKTKP
jgi:WD40 repeat protein/Tfp pilus assembly protein PilF